MIAIGAGRIGTALQRAAQTRGIPFTLIDRKEGWDALDGPPGEPILALVRTDDLGAVADRIPRARVADLVIVQNGMLRESLAALGLERCTRGELYFAVASRESNPIIGYPSILTGLHAPVVMDELVALGIPARDVDWLTFTYYELEKTVWLSAFGLLCESHGVNVGAIAADHRHELSVLVRELMSVGRRVYGIDAPHAFTLDRLVRYAQSIASWPAAVRDIPYRTGWFDDAARRAGMELAAFQALLARRSG